MTRNQLNTLGLLNSAEHHILWYIWAFQDETYVVSDAFGLSKSKVTWPWAQKWKILRYFR